MASLAGKLSKSIEPERERKSSASSRIARLEQDQGGVPVRQVSESGGGEGAARDIRTVPIVLVEDNPYNARRIYKESVVQARMLSIAQSGQITPVLVRPIPGGRFQLVDGQYRKRALIGLGRSEILVDVQAIENEEEMYRLSYVLNADRDGQTPLDNALAWTALLEEGVCETDEQIAKLLNVSKSLVSKTLSLLSLPQSVMDKVAENSDQIGMSIAYELVLYYRASGSEVDTLVLVDTVVNQGLGKRDIENLRNKLAVKPKRQHEMSRQYKVRDLPGISGSLKDWDSGRLILDVKIEDAERRRKILDILKSEFQLDAN